MGELVAFRRFVIALRRERERLGLSLADVAERAKIDKGALSRLENGQQLNPTVNTLARYVHAIGKTLTWGMTDDAEKPTVKTEPVLREDLQNAIDPLRVPLASKKKKKSTQ